MLHNYKNQYTPSHTSSPLIIADRSVYSIVQFREVCLDHTRVTNYSYVNHGTIGKELSGTLCIEIDSCYPTAHTNGYCLFHKDGPKLYHYVSHVEGALSRLDIETAFFKLAMELTGLDIAAISCLPAGGTRKLSRSLNSQSTDFDATLILQHYLDQKLEGILQ